MSEALSSPNLQVLRETQSRHECLHDPPTLLLEDAPLEKAKDSLLCPSIGLGATVDPCVDDFIGVFLDDVSTSLHEGTKVFRAATSALDWKSQEKVAASVMALAGKMTVLTIAHRPSMVRFANTVYSIDAGHIIEGGLREDLLGQPGGSLANMLISEGQPHPDQPKRKGERLLPSC